ncbi:MAG: hypothetical protein Q8L66_15590 [Caulobacter sp.]|nr:hypothetical protein [Caulobacter sp.]
MQRILILGCPGAGKSRLSRALGARLDLPLVHLDALYWRPGWVASALKDFRVRVAAAVASDRWICDGGYGSTYDLRLPRADLIIWLDTPRWLCLLRVMLRWLTHLGRTRADMGPDCPEKVDAAFITYIWRWRRDNRPTLEAALARLAPATPLVTLRSDRAVTAFLDGLPDASG